MNQRIKEIRKANKLRQDVFGEIIGVTGATISRIEKGRRNPSDSVIKSICQQFHISEQWLRTGKGPKETPLVSAMDKLMNLINTMNIDELHKMIHFLNLIVEIKEDNSLRNIE